MPIKGTFSLSSFTLRACRSLTYKGVASQISLARKILAIWQRLRTETEQTLGSPASPFYFDSYSATESASYHTHAYYPN